MSSVDDLHKLAELKERGIISQKEFEKKKAEILRGETSNSLIKEKKGGFIGKLIIAILIVAGIVKFSEKNSNFSSDGTADSNTQTILTAAPPQGPSIEDRVIQLRPREQGALVAAVTAARQQYDGGSNDMAKGASRPARAKALCVAVPIKSVSNWVGVISSLTTNGDGKGVMGIKVGPDAYVTTWNNALSDLSDKTLIEPSSSLFQLATSLSVGQLVRFSGKFYPSQKDCLEESSMSLAGSIRSPEFIFSFSLLSPVN